LYRRPDGLAITTRGDPNGWQAVAATALLRERYPQLEVPEGETWLFEIVLPENRVVVDYGARRDLVLLAAVDIETGRDVELPACWSGPLLDPVAVDAGSLGGLMDDVGADREGFVLHWPAHGLRAKVKMADYLRRHRMIFGTSTKTIWESLAAGGDPLAEVASAPDGLQQFVARHTAILQKRHDAVIGAARAVVDSLRPEQRADRRLAAAVIKNTPYPGLGFLALDGRDDALRAAAWRCVRPERAEAYRTEGAGE
jgi:RNA ligase